MKSFIAKYNGKVYHHDQGIINAVLSDTIGYLPPQYNMMSFIYETKTASSIKFLHDLPFYYTNEEINSAKKHPVFIHFTEGNLQRPWVDNCKHPLLKVWEDYKNQTVWKEIPLKPDNRTFKLKLLSWISLNLPYFAKLIRKVRK